MFLPRWPRTWLTHPKFSATKIRRFQILILVFIIAGSLVWGDQFYLFPRYFRLPLYAWWQSVLAGWRSALMRSLEQAMPEPHASFVAGVILGARENLPPAVIEHFRKTGTSHLIAVSGYNVTVLANSLSSIFIRAGLSRPQAFYFLLIAILNFALLTGAQSAVVRAAIMSAVFMTARHIGRPGNSAISITWAALVMLIFNPSLWKDDLGFQLSFMATLGLIYFSGPIGRRLPSALPKLIKESLASTLAATLLTAPIIVYYFGRLSLSSLPANLLVLPVMPWLMFFGAISMFCGLVSAILGQLTGFFAYIISRYILGVLQIFAAMDYSEVQAPKAQWFFLMVYPVIYLFYRLMTRRRRARV